MNKNQKISILGFAFIALGILLGRFISIYLGYMLISFGVIWIIYFINDKKKKLLIITLCMLLIGFIGLINIST